MKDHEVRQVLQSSIEDGEVNRSDRDKFRQWIENSRPNRQKRALYQSMAFNIVRETVGRNGIIHAAALDWLEMMVKLLAPATTDSPETISEVLFSPQHDCPGRIVRLFENVKSSVDVCVFTITDDRIANAMVAAHRRGIALRVIADNDKCLDPGSDVDWLARSGIPVRIDQTSYHMHHKFAVFDRKLLLNGSYNWTRSAALQNEENFVLESQPGLIQPFQELFNQLWENFAG